MTTFYNHQEIEKKWQESWEKEKLNLADDKSKNPKKYVLDMFPYPSGAGLHVGHVESYTATDIISRYFRMNGYNVLHPQGFDAFGLPAENYAIKTGIHPQEITQKAVQNFKRQIQSIGLSYDWSREINTSSPEYYKWTQWLFLQLYKKGLAYKRKASVNWCPSCQTVLANEQVKEGKCERCESAVTQKDLAQWFFKVTDYAEELLEKIDEMDWPEALKHAQKNWIGKSEGALIKFQISSTKYQINPNNQNSNNQNFIQVFTTRPDTLFGATYLVLAPEHSIIEDLRLKIKNWQEVENYIQQSKLKNQLERTDLNKEKTGVELKGVKAINPATKKEIPIWIADYVLMDYGTGAIMAVPAHDERDWEFAQKYNLEIKQVIAPFFTTIKGPDAVRLDKPTVKRQTVFSFVKHWREDKYLCLDWGKFNWHSGIIGGVNEGETEIEAAKREIQEETGYQNLRLIQQIGGEHHCNFFAGHKDENRYAFGNCYLFELINDERQELNQNELKNHQPIWVEGKRMKEFLNLPNFVLLWEQYQNNTNCFTGEGKLINSEKFNGLLSEEARDKITKSVGGQKKMQYKIRDWLISRQRYWGAPIPVIYCENCPEKEQVLILHGWEDSSKSGFIPALKKNLEGKGYEVYAFDALNTETPKFEEWFYFIEKKIKENKLNNFHLIGHSMGGHLAFKLAEKHKIKKLIAVAPVGFNPSADYFGQFKNKLTDEELAIFKNYQSHSLNVGSVKRNVSEISFIFGGKDPWITKEIRDYYIGNFNEAKIKVLADAKHMCEDDGVKKLAEAEDIFPKVEIKPIPALEKDLPVKLPNDVDFKPTGESSLVRSKSFHNVKCPKCGGAARRESDTMDTFVCSSWYFLRYLDPVNSKEPFSKKLAKKWLPVDLYVGGMEHAVGHLIYARFITKVLRDLGYLDIDEPFLKIRNQGIILAEDSRKMSKRWGNVINPDEVVEEYGADTLRLYEMFTGPLEDAKPWNQKGIIGIRRFLEKVYKFVTSYKLQDTRYKQVPNSNSQNLNMDIERLLCKTIKKVTEDIENLRFNTAISSMMILINKFSIFNFQFSINVIEKFLIILAPFAPHICEELWQSLGHRNSIFKEKWPDYDKKLIVDEEITIAVQINGKLRETILVQRGIEEKDLRSKIEELPKVRQYLQGQTVKKFIYVKEKLVNIVI